jgi:glutamate/tyrosine decarboxylase-like PLP-dependent enzyme
MVDRQVVGWMRDMLGFPETSTGTLTSGGSMANTIALTVARNVMAGVNVRAEGVAAIPQQLAFYVSDQAHSCHAKALSAIGLGTKALRLVPSDEDLRLDPDRLCEAIAEDRRNGLKPACVIATAGTTNSGALDDLIAIGDICSREGLWFHVDGCIGAFLRLSPTHSGKVAGIERADSVALDPHKWLHAPFEAGCVVIRNAAAHFGAFESHGAYLEGQSRALMNAPFLSDYGFDLTRGFKALKIWMSIREKGLDFFGRLIDQNIAQARHLATRIADHPRLELAAPMSLNIVCFRYLPRSSQTDKVNREIMLRLQDSGLAVISDTTIKGRYALRVAVTNHRTRIQDIDHLVRDVLQTGATIEANS